MPYSFESMKPWDWSEILLALGDPVIATRVGAIATRLEAIAIRLDPVLAPTVWTLEASPRSLQSPSQKVWIRL